MKIYTKTGDNGTTGLFGGQRVRKDSVRLDAYGTIDELNAVLGMALSNSEIDDEVRTIILRLQGELMVVGADLATPLDSSPSSAISSVPRVTPDMTSALESEIDQFTEEVGALNHFILPSGSKAASTLHFARTVCRRAERHIALLSQQNEIGPNIILYVNRLSDHLFDLARLVNFRAGVAETKWSRESVS